VLGFAVPCCAALFKQQSMLTASEPTHTSAFPLSVDCTQWQVVACGGGT